MVGAPESLAPAPHRGPTVDVFYVDGVRSRISVSTRQGARHRHFFSIDGGRSRISSSGTFQGVRRRRFLMLMADAPGSPSLALPKGSAVNVS
jgi:hypothetical protein